MWLILLQLTSQIGKNYHKHLEHFNVTSHYPKRSSRLDWQNPKMLIEIFFLWFRLSPYACQLQSSLIGGFYFISNHFIPQSFLFRLERKSYRREKIHLEKITKGLTFLSQISQMCVGCICSRVVYKRVSSFLKLILQLLAHKKTSRS
jgi:hypothetical protein